MQLVILSAGIGSRLKPLTNEKPKCLVEVVNKPILGHQIDLFINNKNVEEILIVIGYKPHLVRSFIEINYGSTRKITCVENKDFLTTNNMYSLFLAKNHVKGKFLLINGDVILHPSIVKDFLSYPYEDSIAVDVGRYFEESMKVIEKDGLLVDISKSVSEQEAFGSSIDFYKFSDHGASIVFSIIENIIIKRKQLNLWSEVALKEILNQGLLKIKPFDIKGNYWFEIDDLEDLKNAEKTLNKQI
ncbi:MAG: sugar phosphate nucleotidyltransferase [Candidatus Hermodarchaeota archaeon]